MRILNLFTAKKTMISISEPGLEPLYFSVNLKSDGDWQRCLNMFHGCDRVCITIFKDGVTLKQWNAAKRENEIEAYKTLVAAKKTFKATITSKDIKAIA